MELTEAKKIAKEFVESQGEIILGFKYGYSDLKEFTSRYYADFQLLTVEGKIPDELPFVGGASGFTIDKKTKVVAVLSFGEYASFQNRELEIEELYQQLLAIKSNNKGFSQLKVKYNLNSKNLLELKRMLDNIDLEKSHILEQLDALLVKID